MADAVLAAALLGAELVSAHVSLESAAAADSSYRPASTAAVVAAGAVLVVPVIWRRGAPLSALVATTAGFLLSRIALEAGDATVTAIVLSLAVYSAAAHGRPRWRNWVCAVCRSPSWPSSGARC